VLGLSKILVKKEENYKWIMKTVIENKNKNSVNVKKKMDHSGHSSA
jgi:hypothetical protein